MPKYLRLLFPLLVGLYQPSFAETISYDLAHDGRQRSYQLYIPDSYRDDSPAPLLIVLHGRGSSAERMANLTRFNARSEVHGFLVAYPSGLNDYWNYLHGIPGAPPGPNDPEFLLRMHEAILGGYSVDTSRVFVAGLSNGGFMAQRLACEASERFAGFASVAASAFAGLTQICSGAGPVRILYMHGTDDRKVPWKGFGIQDEHGNRQMVTLPIGDSMKFWTGHNRCGPEATASEILPQGRSPGTRVRVFSANDCPEPTAVVLYAILGGGHNWPGVADFIPPDIAGQVNLDIHASDVIWSFFDR
jgi:polyhydroxybutyrate depolymerase